MCLFQSPKMPAIQPRPDNSVIQDTAIVASLDAERRRRAAQSGIASTILAGKNPPAQPGLLKTALGQ